MSRAILIFLALCLVCHDAVARLYEIPLNYKHELSIDLKGSRHPLRTPTEDQKDQKDVYIEGDIEDLVKRAIVYSSPVDYESYYSVGVALGGQESPVWLNTVDNWLWLYNVSEVPKCADDYSKIKEDCSYDGYFYNESASNGYFVDQNQTFYDMFLDGRYITGEQVQDTFVFGFNGDSAIALENYTFGLVNYSSFPSTGQFGLGRAAEVFSRLDTTLYSLYRTDNVSSATLLFGGVNTSLFDQLYVLPKLSGVVNLSPNAALRGGSYDFIALSNFYAYNQGVYESVAGDEYFDIPVMLDSSNVFSFLPANLIVGIAMQIGASYYKSENIWLQKCAYRNLSGVFVAEFGHEAKIPLPLSSILIPVYSKDDGKPLVFTTGEEVCALSFLPSEWVGYSSFGAPVLAQMYILVDHGNSQIGVAPLPQDITNVEFGKSTSSFVDSAKTVTSLSSASDSSSTNKDKDKTTTAADSSTSSTTEFGSSLTGSEAVKKARTTSTTKVNKSASTILYISNNITKVNGVTVLSNATSVRGDGVTISSAQKNFTDIGNQLPLMLINSAPLYLSDVLSTQMIVTPGVTSELDSLTSIFASENSVPSATTTKATSSSSHSKESLRPLSASVCVIFSVILLLTIT